MQLKELKPEEDIVEINGHDYLYKGIEKRYVEKMGTKDCFIFYSEKLKSEKTFLESKNSKFKLKNTEGKLSL